MLNEKTNCGKVKVWRRLKLCLLAGLAIALACACGGNKTQISGAASSDVRVINHAIGETQVPVNPQRIVTLNSPENVLALGLKPVGSTSADYTPAYLEGKLNGIADIGQRGEPNLEKILALKPDLILGLSDARQIYQQLSQIAPTVLVKFESSGDWKRVLLEDAAALGKTDNAQQLMANYYRRLEQFKAQMGNRLQELEVSVVRIAPEKISLYLKDTFIGTVIDDAGLRRPPAQAKTSSFADEISQERLSDADGDVIFVWTYGSTAQYTQGSQKTLQRLKVDPLWSQLQAVQQNKVYEVPGYWIGSSPLAANAVIDDLFKYLLEAGSNSNTAG